MPTSLTCVPIKTRVLDNRCSEMQLKALHEWDCTPSQAISLQKQLAGTVECRPPLTRCEFVAGADVSYNRFSPTFYAVVVVLRTADASLVNELRRRDSHGGRHIEAARETS
jgi:deoxyribonuclease V